METKINKNLPLQLVTFICILLLLTSLCDFILPGQHLQDKCLSIFPIAESLYMDSAISTLLISQRG